MEAKPPLIDFGEAPTQMVCFGLHNQNGEKNFSVGGREVVVIVSRREERKLILRLLVGAEISSDLEVDLDGNKVEGSFAEVNFSFRPNLHKKPALICELQTLRRVV